MSDEPYTEEERLEVLRAMEDTFYAPVMANIIQESGLMPLRTVYVLHAMVAQGEAIVDYLGQYRPSGAGR